MWGLHLPIHSHHCHLDEHVDELQEELFEENLQLTLDLLVLFLGREYHFHRQELEGEGLSGKTTSLIQKLNFRVDIINIALDVGSKSVDHFLRRNKYYIPVISFQERSKI